MLSGRYQFLAAGKDPFVAAYIAHGRPSAVNVARDFAAKAARTASAAVASLATSFWGWGTEMSDATGSSAPAEDSTLERPVPVRPELGSIMKDPTRQCESLVPDPTGRMVAATDGFGRVVLIDVTGGVPVAVRMWKGYRDAQVVWVHSETAAGARADELPLALLVIYVPRRGLLEVWPPRVGSRLAALSLGGVGWQYRLFGTSKETSAGLRTGATSRLPPPRASCRCILLRDDGQISQLEVKIRTPNDLHAPTHRTDPSPQPRQQSLDDAKEQVLYRNFLSHLASGAGEVCHAVNDYTW
jgi:hypothetical protein